MADSAVEKKRQPTAAAEEPKAVQKEVIATKVSGYVIWFNDKTGYGFINRSDTKEDVFVHRSAIVTSNTKKLVRSVGNGEKVEFDVVLGKKRNEAVNVTGLNGESVKGSPHAAFQGHSRQYFGPRRGAPRRGPRTDSTTNVREKEDEVSVKETGSGGDSGSRGGRGGRGRGRGGGVTRRFYRSRGIAQNDPTTSGVDSENQEPQTQSDDDGKPRKEEAEENPA